MALDSYGNEVNQSSTFTGPSVTTIGPGSMPDPGFSKGPSFDQAPPILPKVDTYGNTINLSAITPNNTSPVAPVIPPVTPVPVVPASISGSADALTAQLLQADKAATDAALNAVNTDKTNLGSVNARIQGIQTARSGAEGDINTPGTPAYLAEVARKAGNDLLISQRAQANALKAIDNAPGMTLEGKELQKREISRQYASEQADLMLSYHLANSDYTAAEKTLNDKMKLDLEPLKTQYDYVNGLLKNDLSSLSTAQKNALDDKRTQIKDVLDQVKDNQTTIREWVSKAISEKQPDLIKELAKLNPASPTFNDDLGKISVKLASTGGNGVFTQTQLNKGAANAGVPISEFNGYDADTKNYFINNYDEFKSFQQKIDNAHTTGSINLPDGTSTTSSATTLKGFVNTSNLPELAKTKLNTQIDTLFPASSASAFEWWNPSTWFK